MSFHPGLYRCLDDGQVYEVISTVRDRSKAGQELSDSIRRVVLYRATGGECFAMPVLEFIEEVWTGKRFARRFERLEAEVS